MWLCSVCGDRRLLETYSWTVGAWRRKSSNLLIVLASVLKLSAMGSRLGFGTPTVTRSNVNDLVTRM